MNDKAITVALQNVLESVEDSIWYDESRMPYLTQFSEEQGANLSVTEFMRILKGTSDLEIFNGYMHVLEGSSSRLEFYKLAQWMIWKAKQTSPEEAVANMRRYLQEEEIPCLQIQAIFGLKVDSPCELGLEVSLLPWEYVPNTWMKQDFEVKYGRSPLLMAPHAALVRERPIRKLHCKAEDLPRELEPVEHEILEDARLCVSLVGPFGIRHLASWIDLPEWAPIRCGSSIRPCIEGYMLYQVDQWSDRHQDQARDLFTAFRNLKKKERASLRLATRHLVRAIIGQNNVDRSIDIGIALEALFLADTPDDRTELTFRLRVRAARWLEIDSQSRQEIYQLVGDIYKLRSSAVHAGKVADMVRSKRTSEVLESGIKMTASAIRRIIIEGRPDWTEIALT